MFENRRSLDIFSGMRLAAVLVLAALLAGGGVLFAGAGAAAAAEAVAAVGPAAEEPAPGAEAEPEDTGPFTVVVFGDSLADGIWAGVYRALRRDDRFDVRRHTRVSSGLSRPDYFDWQAALDEYLGEEEVDAVIISLGLNDAQPIFHEGRWDHAFGTEPWTEIYRGRVGDFMARLAEAGVPTFWVGLPTVRSDSFAERVAHLNEIYAAMAAEHGVVFVPTREITADEEGRYSAYLADEDGRSRLVRANDGIHFTTRGYELLGQQLVATMREELSVFRTDEDGDAETGADDADE